MADGLWATVCEVASSVGESIKQLAAPTKSATEIELNQKAREVKAADDVSAAYEKLSDRDAVKISKGMTIFNAVLAAHFDESDKPKEGEKDG